MAYLPPEERFKRFPNFLYDSTQAASIPAEYPPDEHTPKAAVERVAATGGICIKAAFERGFDRKTGQLPVPTIDLMRQVKEVGHNHSLPLLLHANSLEAHRFAVDVGVDAVAHGLWNWNRRMPSSPDFPNEVRQVLDDEVRNGIAYMPTTRVLGGLADLFDPAFLDEPYLAAVLPKELLAWYRTDDAKWFQKEVGGDFNGMPTERIRALWGTVAQRNLATSYIAAHGGRIAFGSDTPSAPTYANPPGYNGYLELREMEEAGLSPRQILLAATLENARLFGLSNDYGVVTVGKIANLLLLRTDPLKSTAAYDTLEAVIVKGKVIQRNALKGN
jgi:imidazolonepropionase-like amidohydrolase